ncbi:MAG TPA: hypothetical protein VL651_00410 [Bacteroidia bacterium]|jgi:hypothetical protein|nr:hypothetical protein [Bacteroidia bacterium]
MKKIILLFLFSALLAPHSELTAQVTQPGKLLFEAGIGIGIQHYQFTDLNTHLSNPRDTSGAVEIPLTFEYGIKKWFGAGMLCNFENYLHDSTNHGSYKGFDLVPSVFFHIPWGLEKIDLYAHLGFGYTHFKFDANNSFGDVYAANGSVFNWGLTFRWLFSTDGHFGMHFWYSHDSYNYPHGELTDNFGNHEPFSLDGPGNNFGLGFFLRF